MSIMQEEFIDIEFRESDTEDSDKQKEIQLGQITGKTQKKVLVVVLAKDLVNPKRSVLSRIDISEVCKILFQSYGLQQPLPFIDHKEVMMEPILSTGQLKAQLIISVEQPLYEILMKQPLQVRHMKDQQKEITRLFNYSFSDLAEIKNKFKILQTGKFQNEFIEVQQRINTPRNTSIFFAVNIRDQQRILIKQKLTWEQLYRNESYEFREVKSLLRLNHKNVLRLFSWWLEEEAQQNGLKQQYLYEQLEYIAYHNVHDLLQYIYLHLNPLEFVQKKRRIREIFKQIIEGLIHINEQGIFHRDIKPENVLVTLDFWSNIIIKIGDFDLAKDALNQDAVPQKWTYQSRLTGTAGYTSQNSEQDKLYDQTEELYQLGMVLLDLCYVHADTNLRQQYHIQAKQGLFPQDLSNVFHQEFDLVMRLLKREFKDFKALLASLAYQNYIQQN
ncbi:hypothetical protein pb186bvf_014909 [Paramecium bursaria]